MRVAGTAADWINLIDSLVPDIIRLVLDTWAAMPPPASNALEDPTSEALCRCLRTGRNRCDLPFNIYLQLVELDPAAGEDQGRMDIVFALLVPREHIYFCLECKRLNVRETGAVRPYASEYVRHGMLRFVRGQYAAHVRHGGMLGFVLDGDVPSAMTNVEANIRAQCEELGMDPPGAFRVSGIYPEDGRIRETHHRRRTPPNFLPSTTCSWPAIPTPRFSLANQQQCLLLRRKNGATGRLPATPGNETRREMGMCGWHTKEVNGGVTRLPHGLQVQKRTPEIEKKKRL